MMVFPVLLISDCLLTSIIRYAPCRADSTTEGPDIFKEGTCTEELSL